MELNRRWITHSRQGQAMTGYLVTPAMVKTPLPVILVIQEIWGPDEHIQDVAERYAAAGYVALAPDLYSRGGRPEPLSPARIEELKSFMNTVPPEAWQNQALMQQAIQKEPADKAKRIQETMGMLFGGRDMDGMVEDLKAWIDYVDGAPESQHQKLASIGYCMGGALSFRLAATDERVKAALVYYGTAPDEAEMARVHCPVYGFYGETDSRITGAVPEVAKAMAAHGKQYHYQIYQGAGHAFFNDSRSSYDVRAARDAFARSLSIFNERLS